MKLALDKHVRIKVQKKLFKMYARLIKINVYIFGVKDVTLNLNRFVSGMVEMGISVET